jgi:two-component sensor histidine kinase
MQSVFLRMASSFLNTPLEHMHETINSSLAEIGTFVGADRAYVFEYDWAQNVANNTHEWCNDGVAPEIENLQRVPNEVIHYWVTAHRRGTEVSIEDVLNLPATDGVRQVLEPQGVKSVLALPMMNRGECIGFVGFDSVKEIRRYSTKEKTLLTVFSEMLVNIGQRKELEQHLVQARDRAEEKSADLTAMIEGTTQSIWAFDRNYAIRYINERFRSDFHAAFGTWLDIGSSLIDALPEALRPVWKPRYDRALANNRFIVTDEVATATGTTYIQVSFNPIVQGDRVIGGSCFGSDITDRKEAEIEIKKQLNEKETLLREVHHRVKNNMTMIESLLAMQADRSSLPAVTTALHETISRVQSSRVLYDKLLVSDDMNEISVERYANGLIDAIATVFDIENNVTIERQIADFRISQRNAFALGIIINELLTNLFKYAFKDHSGGAVSIVIDKDEQTVRLMIHDNGVGFDTPTLKNGSSGFGLTVVKMLVEQSGGSYTQSNDNGAKSVVYLNL